MVSVAGALIRGRKSRGFDPTLFDEVGDHWGRAAGVIAAREYKYPMLKTFNLKNLANTSQPHKWSQERRVVGFAGMTRRWEATRELSNWRPIPFRQKLLPAYLPPIRTPLEVLAFPYAALTNRFFREGLGGNGMSRKSRRLAQSLRLGQGWRQSERGFPYGLFQIRQRSPAEEHP